MTGRTGHCFGTDIVLFHKDFAMGLTVRDVNSSKKEIINPAVKFLLCSLGDFCNKCRTQGPNIRLRGSAGTLTGEKFCLMKSEAISSRTFVI